MIKKYSASLPENFGGMVFRKIPISQEGKIVFTEKYIDSNPIDIVFKYNILGDKGEIFKTDILRKYFLFLKFLVKNLYLKVIFGIK